MNSVLRAKLATEARHELTGDQPIVEDVEVALGGKAAHPFPVGAYAACHNPPPHLSAEPDIAAGDLDARRHTLDIPLPRTGESLVEVVGTKDEPTVGSGEAAEVGDVGIPAGLHGDPRVRRRRQVGSHHRRRAAIERERRDEHPPVADRDELPDAQGCLGDENRDRIGPVRRWRPVPVRRAGRDLARGSPSFSRLPRLQSGVGRGNHHGATVEDDRSDPRAGNVPTIRYVCNTRPSRSSAKVAPTRLGLAPPIRIMQSRSGSASRLARSPSATVTCTGRPCMPRRG